MEHEQVQLLEDTRTSDEQLGNRIALILAIVGTILVAIGARGLTVQDALSLMQPHCP